MGTVLRKARVEVHLSVPAPVEDPMLQRAIAGDRAAREALVREHGPSVRGLCRRLDPEPDDAWQEAWARIFATLHRLDPAHPQGAGGWIRTVTHRLLVDRHRRRRTRGRVLSFPDADGVSPSGLRVLEARDQVRQLEGALALLPDGWRRVVVLHHVHGVALEAIAQQENIAVGTVKSRLHRARARLVTALRAAGEDR